MRSWPRAFLNASLILAASRMCCAADLNVHVADSGGKPVENVVFIAKSTSAVARPPQSGATAIMDQLNKEFVPEILVVRTGTAVLFPNSDSVAHQVYSFSQAKRFELPLYRGRPYPPQVFDQPGVVTLGCNIHDRMVGYIVVTDSPYFAQSDAQGNATVKNIAPGAYRLSAWHPRFNETVPDRTLSVAESGAELSIRLTKPMQSRAANSERRIRDY